MPRGRKILNCPECGQPLTDLHRKVEMVVGCRYEVEWLCENCDLEFVFMKGRGLISVDEFERLVDDEKIVYYGEVDWDEARQRRYPRKLGDTRGER